MGGARAARPLALAAGEVGGTVIDRQTGLRYVADWVQRRLRRAHAARLASWKAAGMSAGDLRRIQEGQESLLRTIREAIGAGDLVEASMWLGNDTGLEFAMLELGCDYVPASQLAEAIDRVWTNGKARIPAARLLPIFRAASDLRATVPADWPEAVTIFRGVTAKNARTADRRMRELAWTADRLVAVWFAGRYCFDEGPERSYVGTATIPKARILAVFTGRDEVECIVDPADLGEVVVAEVTADQLTAARETLRRRRTTVEVDADRLAAKGGLR